MNMSLTSAALHLAAILALLDIASCYADPKRSRVLRWTGGSFKWPSPSTRSIYTKLGRYVSKHVIATRGQIHEGNLFVVLPRYKEGIPATLARISLRKKDSEPVLEPFPRWSMQEEGNCKSIQSAVDILLDDRDVLWVLDDGAVNAMHHRLQSCPPKVMSICSKTGEVMKVLDLSRLVTSESRLQNVVVDDTTDGAAYVYVSDSGTRSILVYDVHHGKGHRVVLPEVVQRGCQSPDVLYASLLRKECGTQYLFFTFLCGERMFAVESDILRRGSEAAGKIIDIGPKPGRIVILGTDSEASIFFRHEGLGEVFRWNCDTAMKPENFKSVHRPQYCQVATHVISGQERGRMSILESNFLDYVQGTAGSGAVQSLSSL